MMICVYRAKEVKSRTKLVGLKRQGIRAYDIVPLGKIDRAMTLLLRRGGERACVLNSHDHGVL